MGGGSSGLRAGARPGMRAVGRRKTDRVDGTAQCAGSGALGCPGELQGVGASY